MGGGRPVARAVVPQSQYKNAPVVVTGKQTGVENPKDAKKVTEMLKIKRQKEEGTYVDPNLTTVKTLENSLLRSGGRGIVARNKRSARLRGKTKSSGNKSGGKV